MAAHMTTEARRELVGALRDRYRAGSRAEKTRILEEFVAVSGYHRKAAIRILNGSQGVGDRPDRLRRPWLYDEAVRQALIVLWEASDRVCGKRLQALLPVLLPALERHGHLQLDPIVRHKLTTISAASIDRLLREVRAAGLSRRSRRQPTAAQRSVPVRTFADWLEALGPGYTEIDLVAHSGPTMSGSVVHTLTLTDVASGWTECLPLLVREASLVAEALEAMRSRVPFALRGVDSDNGSEFLNDTLLAYCASHALEFTRSRPYHKNDQAWVEQKNGSVVRHLVGYRRLEGVAATEALAALYGAARLFVNFFQPSFKLKDKVRHGARVVKHYYPPQTPCARLLASDAIADSTKDRLRSVAQTLDPLQLLSQIRHWQHELASLADNGHQSPSTPQQNDLTRFLASLSTAWHDGEVRPTHTAAPKPARQWRTRADPFQAVWPEVCTWLEKEPNRTGKALLKRLQERYPGRFPDGQLRTLQRRLKAWRSQRAHELIFGGASANQPAAPDRRAKSPTEENAYP